MTEGPTITGEAAAEQVLSCRRAYAKLRRRWMEGERSRELLGEVRQVANELARIIDRLNGPRRAIWSSLLAKCRTLESDLLAYRTARGCWLPPTAARARRALALRSAKVSS